MGPTGPKYPSVGTDGGGPNVWSSISNAFAVDGSSALGGMPGGGDVTNPLFLSGFGFAIPSTAVIEGIKMEYLRSGVNAAAGSIKLTKTAGVVVGSEKADFSLDFYPASLDWFTYGGPTDLWGTTWTPAEINASGFGVEITAYNTHGGGSASIDAVRVTVYWRTGPADVPKRYLYKSYNSAGVYIGNLPSVISEFGYTQDIDTGGVQIEIECAVSADTARQNADTLTDEAGNILTDENSVNLTTEGVIPVAAPGDSSYDALIKNGNLLQIWEYSYYYPNGKCMFLGQIERWEASMGGETGDETTKILAYSDGQDLDNYLIRGNPYTYTGDVTQTTQNSNYTVDAAGMGAAWDRAGQTWKVGVGVTNLGAISLLLLGSADVTINVYASPSMAVLLGTVTQTVSVAGATEIQFGFPTSIPVTAGNSYFFTINVAAGQSILVYYQNTDVYANGSMYTANFGGGSGGGSYGAITGDMYFKTFSGTGSTIGTFTSMDPTTGMLETFFNDYNARGGLINYSSSTIDATGLSLTYGFNTNTIYEGVRAVRSMCPSGFYYYVDIGTDLIYVKRASTAADIVLTKGRHIGKFRLVATIEGIKNVVNFTGGPTAGVNLYKQYQDATSVARYGTKLDRKTDNRVTVSATADAIGTSSLADGKDEKYQSTVTILDRTMDITLVKPGLVIGFNGYGTFVDNILAQIVSINYTPGAVHCVLGIIPKRLTPEFDKITRGLIAQQTIANPSAPS